jgi:formylglycine-generating enzyme required for sulfatase activity
MAEIPGAEGLSSFAMSRREIRYKDWRACVADGACRPRTDETGAADRPVVNVSIEDAQAYVFWLSQKTGRRYRLPTAAEWLSAAKDLPSEANFRGALGSGRQARETTVPSGSFPPSALGLFDMNGNAAEWTAECAEPGQPVCLTYVVLGGSFRTPKELGPTREERPAGTREASIGFRVVRDL